MEFKNDIFATCLVYEYTFGTCLAYDYAFSKCLVSG